MTMNTIRIGISTIVYHWKTGSPDGATALKGLAELGFKQVEYSDLSRPYVHEDREHELIQLRTQAEAWGIKIAAAHIPPLDDAGLEKTVGIIKTSINSAGVLGAEFVILHPGWIGDSTSRNDSIPEICERAREKKMKILLENMPAPSQFDLKSIVAIIKDCNDDVLGICLDVGHSWLSNVNPAEDIKKAGRFLSCLHLHDNDRSADQHLIPFEGSIPWHDVAAALKETDFQGLVTLECHSSLQYSQQSVIAAQAKSVVEELLKN